MKTNSSKIMHFLLLAVIVIINFLLLHAGWAVILQSNGWVAKLLARFFPNNLTAAARVLAGISFLLAFACVVLMSWLFRRSEPPKASDDQEEEATEEEDEEEIDEGIIQKETLARMANASHGAPVYARRTMWLAVVMLLVVILFSFRKESVVTTRTVSGGYAIQADRVSLEVAQLSKMLFDEKPPSEKLLRQILIFSTGKESFSAAMHTRFPEDLKDCKYSLLGILLREHRDQLQVLKEDYQLIMTWRYSQQKGNDFPIPYVIVTPSQTTDNPYAGELIFAIEPTNGRLLLNGSTINGNSFLDALNVLHTGEFTRKQWEDEFLDYLQPYLHEEKVSDNSVEKP